MNMKQKNDKNKQIDTKGFLFSCVVKALIDNGINDPDLYLFNAVFQNEPEEVKKALDNGANPNVTDTSIIRKYFDTLIKPPISERLALAVIGVLGSPSLD